MSEQEHKTVIRKKKSRFFESYISKLLKSISTKSGITSNAKQQLNGAICIISDLVATKTLLLTKSTEMQTETVREVGNAVKLIFGRQLAAEADTIARNAIETFSSSDVVGSSRQAKAGIIFPPAMSDKFLRNFGYSDVMLSKDTPVYFASAIQTIATKILTVALNYATVKRVRVTIRDLELGVRRCPLLNSIFIRNNITFLGGGVVPYTHPSLLPKKRRKRRVKSTAKPTEPGVKKKFKFKPGTVALREIRRFQKMSNCLTFAKKPFEKLVRDVVAEFGDVRKVSKNVFILLQYFIEQQVIEVLHRANYASIHAGRVKLVPNDIKLVDYMMNQAANPYIEELVAVTDSVETNSEVVVGAVSEVVDVDDDEDDEDDEDSDDEEEELEVESA